MARISAITARQILDSRGNPTVEAEVILSDGSFGRAAVPSGASTGSREALELRDGGTKYLGKSVEKAVTGVQSTIASSLKDEELTQEQLDRRLLELDGSENKSNLGANALLGVSLAFAVAQAQSNRVQLFQWVAQLAGTIPSLPRPMLNIMNGGVHADWATDIQEFMILPLGDEPFAERLRKSVEVFHHLGKLIAKEGLSTNVGNEGGYAPQFTSNSQAFDFILEAISAAGYRADSTGDFMLGLDIASSEFYQDGSYHLRRDNKTLSTEEMIGWVEQLTKDYPLLSLEDPLAESDWAGWQQLTARLGGTHQIVGDDLLVTNSRYIQQAIEQKSCNALLAKLNQIGTLTETLEAMQLAKNAGWALVPSHRSGETEDVFLAHFAVGTGAGQIKTGAPSRTDRTAKYNELLRIAERIV